MACVANPLSEDGPVAPSPSPNVHSQRTPIRADRRESPVNGVHSLAREPVDNQSAPRHFVAARTESRTPVPGPDQSRGAVGTHPAPATLCTATQSQKSGGMPPAALSSSSKGGSFCRPAAVIPRV